MSSTLLLSLPRGDSVEADCNHSREFYVYNFGFSKLYPKLEGHYVSTVRALPPLPSFLFTDSPHLSVFAASLQLHSHRIRCPTSALYLYDGIPTPILRLDGKETTNRTGERTRTNGP